LTITTTQRVLEKAWAEPEGFFYRLRQGDFNAPEADTVAAALEDTVVDEEGSLPRRFVSLSWWIPIFMEWQVERVRERGGDVDSLKQTMVRMRNALDRVLGVP
jgi:hypothetical protein